MNEPTQETNDAAMQDAVRQLQEALQDPEIAQTFQDVRRHLGSFTFDPVGTLDKD